MFHYRLFKYYYDETEQTFKPCQFKIETLTYNQIHERYGRGADEKTVQENTTFFEKNLTKIPEKSCLRLTIEEILSPFYIFQVSEKLIFWLMYQIVFQLYCVVL